MKPLLGTGSYAELMDDTKPKYAGNLFVPDEIDVYVLLRVQTKQLLEKYGSELIIYIYIT